MQRISLKTRLIKKISNCPLTTKFLLKIMMKPAKITTSYSSLNDANLEKKALLILSSMTGNSSFSEIQDGVSLLAESIKRFTETRNVLMGYMSTIDADNRASRQDLLSCIKKLGLLVTTTATGDESKLLSSGFTMAA